MNQSTHPTRHPFMRFYAAPALLLLLTLGVSPGVAQGQWVTNGNNIGNTNTGNVGIGTTAPTAKLDVNGDANFSGPTTVAGRGTFSLDTNNSLNFSIWTNPFKINAPSLLVNGALETFDNYFGVRHTPNNTLTVYIPSAGSAYFNQGNVGIGTATPNGKLDVVGAGGAPNFATGLTGVLRVGAANEHIEFGYVAGSRNWIQGFGAVPLYINEGGNNVILNSGGGNVGIGNTSPAYRLDVNGEINATGLRINGTPVGAGGSSPSQWTTSGSNIHFNTGNIGIGTATPATKLDVRTPSQVNDGFQLAGSDSHFLLLRPSSPAGAHNNLV